MLWGIIIQTQSDTATVPDRQTNRQTQSDTATMTDRQTHRHIIKLAIRHKTSKSYRRTNTETESRAESFGIKVQLSKLFSALCQSETFCSFFCFLEFFKRERMSNIRKVNYYLELKSKHHSKVQLIIDFRIKMQCNWRSQSCISAHDKVLQERTIEIIAIVFCFI